MSEKVCSHYNTRVLTRKEIYPVLGAGIEITAKVKHCDDCGEDLFDLTLEEHNLLNAYEKYKKEHGLLSYKEIIKIREYSGLTAEDFANLIGCSAARYVGFESGRIQSIEEDRLIRLMSRKENIEFLQNLKAR